MKYRIIGLCAVLLAGLAVLAVSFAMPDENGQRYIQHIDAEPKAPCLSHAGEDVLCTHLPVVRIETGGVEIPGRVVQDSEFSYSVYTKAADGSTTIPAQLEIVDHETENNHFNDAATLSSEIRIRIRGNSSREFDKPNYFIRLLEKDGTNNAQPLLGMDAHHEWALHGPFLDKSLIRNYMWYNLAGQIMDYSPDVRFCEVMIDGKYQGVYLMTEMITAGKNGARLSLEINKKDNSFSGYLIRLDWKNRGSTSIIHPFTDYSFRAKTHLDTSRTGFEIVYPGSANLNEELKEAIKDDFSAFEKMLYSYDYDSDKYGYTRNIDVDSFIDYFLLNEYTCNYDALSLSTYLYRDVDGLLHMCVWDFNSACDLYRNRIIPATGFQLHEALWYIQLFKDQDFTDRMIERYGELRESVLSEEYLYSFIDDTIAYLGDAIGRNYAVWGYSFNEAYDLISPLERNPRNYEDSILQIKDFLAERTAFMDENIETLRQYSAESKIKKYNEIAS